jgi:type I restriction enzyme M protein
LAVKVRGGVGSQANYLSFLLCLVFLRGCATQYWSELQRITGSGLKSVRPGGIIRRIGDLTDQALRNYGILPGVQPELERLRPRSAADLAEVIRLCDQLGPDAFSQLLGRFAAETQLRSTDFFTPKEVAHLMASLVIKEGGIERPVYDPYLRGGELLQAASSVQPVANPPFVKGESPNRETLRLAGMNLALHGQPAELRLGSSTPWEDLDKPRPLADAVLLNPPFNIRGALTRKHTDSKWLFGSPPPNNGNYAWLQYAIESLLPSGTAAVLMPNQAGIASTEQEQEIRQEMVEQGAVEAIIALPSNLFQSTNTSVTLWIVRPPTDFPGRILFIDARQMSIRSRTGPALAPDAVRLISGLYTRRHVLAEGDLQRLPDGAVGVSAGIAALRRTNYSLNPSDYMGSPMRMPLHASSAHAADSLRELANLRSRANSADSRVQELRPLPRTGFAGDLPSDWRRLPLAELCNIQAGPSYSRLGVEERTAHGSVPIVMPRHLRDGRITGADMDSTTDEIARQLARFRLSVDDILCIRSGAMGEPALVEEQQEGWLFGTNLLRLQLVDSDAADPRYLLGFLSLHATLDWIRNRSHGTVIPSISARSLGFLLIDLPPLAEQRQVGAALLAFDEQIAAHQDFKQAAIRARATLAEHLMEGAVTLQ